MVKKLIKAEASSTKKKVTSAKKAPSSNKKRATPKKTAKARPKTMPAPLPNAPDARVLDQLWGTVLTRSTANPNESHSARLLSRGTGKVAQKFGEEAVECVIEAVAKNRTALIGESADVLYHLIVLWIDAELRPEEVWSELKRREGMSGLAEKAARKMALPGFPTKKIP